MAAKPDSSKGEADLGLEGLRQLPGEAGLSLDQLTAAFAEMLSEGNDPYSVPPPDPSEAEELVPVVAEPADVAADHLCDVTPRTILEAMLFVGPAAGGPLSPQQVARMMRGVRPAEIDLLVRELNADYAARNCPYHIEVEGAGYRLRLLPQYDRLRDKFLGKTRQARLSQAAIEVLAIVAYNPLLTSDEINRLRGTPSGPILNQLVRRELLLLQRPDKPGERKRYQVTDRFLELFGLENLADLPRSDELQRE